MREDLGRGSPPQPERKEPPAMRNRGRQTPYGEEVLGNTRQKDLAFGKELLSPTRGCMNYRVWVDTDLLF